MSIDRACELQAEGWRLYAEARLDEAASVCRDALRLVEESEGVVSWDAANLLNDLAEIECDRNDFPTARVAIERARRIEDELAGPELDSPCEAATERDGGDRIDYTIARLRARTLSIAGEIRRTQGDYVGAEADLMAALATTIAVFGASSNETAVARNNLGVMYKYWGRYEEGLGACRSALESILAAEGECSPAAAAVYHNIGGLFHSRGDFAAAEEPARKAWEISRRLAGDDACQTMRDAVAYAAVLDGLGRGEESEGIYRRALSVFEGVFGSCHGEVAAVLHNLAAALESNGRREEAERCYRQALAIKEAIASEAPDTALTRNNLGKLLIHMGQSREAAMLLEAAVAVLERQLTSSHPHLVLARRNLQAVKQYP